MKQLNKRIFDWLRNNRDVTDETAVSELAKMGLTNARGNPITIRNVRAWRKTLEQENKSNNHEVKKQSELLPADHRRLEFATIWNDKTYKTPYDLEIALGSKWSSIQVRAGRYRKYREEHPELQNVLPLLLWRKAGVGGHVILDEEDMLLLEPWKFKQWDALKKTRGVVVTAAQRGATINTHFWESLLQYCAHNEYVLIVLPIQYGKYKKETLFPKELKGYIAFEDIPLQKGTLNLSTTRLRPTLQRFLTDSVCEMGGTATQVFAAPKHELEHRPRLSHHYPKGIMTTGAVTHPNYAIDNLGQQDRTGEVATSNHAYGAIVIEFEKSDAFHFRQLNAGSRGIFYDIDPAQGGARLFTPKGTEHRPNDVVALVCGDWHTGKTSKEVDKATFGGKTSMTSVLDPNHVILHDFVDCDSVSHHDKEHAVRRVHKAREHYDSLQRELNEAAAELERILTLSLGKVHIIPSNHNEFVKRWMEQLEFCDDNVNLKFGMELFLMTARELINRSPLKHETRSLDPVNLYFRYRMKDSQHINRLITHERQDVLLLPDTLPQRESKKRILLSMHGDIGALGGRTSGLAAFRKMNQRIIVAHNHSAAILGPIWRVGTSTTRQEHYMNTPMTNWTNTHAVIYANSQRQLINVVKGGWHGKKRSGAK